MTDTIPNRPVFRAHEVCELAEVQPYVLRTWEAEFPDLGVTKNADSPRVYRRGDVERVLRIKHLLFVDGLTLAGVRRRLTEENGPAVPATVNDADVAAMIDGEARQHLRAVRGGLQWILGVLSGANVTAEEFVLSAPAPRRSAAMKSSAVAARSKSVKSTRAAKVVKKAARPKKRS